MSVIRAALTVGLVNKTCANHAQFAAERQVCFNGLGNEDFRLVVGIAERSGFAALVKDLPVGFLGVAKPYVGTGLE